MAETIPIQEAIKKNYAVHYLKERTTKEYDYQLEEVDYGELTCPYKAGRPNVDPTCSSNCPYFWDRVKSLGLDVPTLPDPKD